MLRIFLLLSCFLFSCTRQDQSAAATAAPAPATEKKPADTLKIDSIFRQLHDAHGRYEEPSITTRRFKHADIEPLLKKLKPPFEVEEAGRSIEGRSIYQVKLGSGPTTVLLWSQMHGDEPTATMALMDLFNFFRASDEFDALRERLLSELTLYFIPLLNPDGAEVFERYNALGIDLNRDALRLQCPESQLLKRVRDETEAGWGFNLHDQSKYYAAGDNPKTASISFLAPAYNVEKEIDEGRANAMKLIVVMNQVLQEYIPGKVGKYDDTFEPRAFGDNIQKWGTNTILIESGGLEDDPEKQYLRQLNFTMLLAAFNAIASGEYQAADVENYHRLPFNEGSQFFDLLLREVQVQKEGKWYTVDLGFRHREVEYDEHQHYYPRASINDIGDLSVYYAYEQLDAKGYKAIPGKTYSKVYSGLDALQQEDIHGLLQQGYTVFQVSKMPARRLWAELPVELTDAGKSPANEVRRYGNPSLVLQKDGQTHYALINGFLYDLRRGRDAIQARMR